jgi:hypothetical protein
LRSKAIILSPKVWDVHLYCTYFMHLLCSYSCRNSSLTCRCVDAYVMRRLTHNQCMLCLWNVLGMRCVNIISVNSVAKLSDYDISSIPDSDIPRLCVRTHTSIVLFNIYLCVFQMSTQAVSLLIILVDPRFHALTGGWECLPLMKDEKWSNVKLSQ